MKSPENRLIQTYDVTLREGPQTGGVNKLTPDRKLAILGKLAEMKVHYVEGGLPAKKNDAEFFRRAQELKLTDTHLVAFGTTARKGHKAKDDEGLNVLLESGVNWIALVAKGSLWQVKNILETTEGEYLETLEDSVRYLRENGKDVVVDLEHFFDGFYSNKEYALKVIKTAKKAGASQVALCDTNGGTDSAKIFLATLEAKNILGDNVDLGIHVHNDSDLATANTLIAVEAGADVTQVTINGIGERTGNANFCTVLPNLHLRGYHLGQVNLGKLTDLAVFTAHVTDIPLPKNAPFVGENAGKHKGGLHLAAVAKNPWAYQAFDLSQFGNKNTISYSDQTGKNGVIEMAKEYGFVIEKDDPRVDKILKILEESERELADVQLFNLVDKYFGERTDEIFTIEEKGTYSIIRWGKGSAEAVVKIRVNGDSSSNLEAAESKNGSLDAFNLAVKNALREKFPEVDNLRLTNHEIHKIWDGGEDTASSVVVTIDFEVNGEPITSQVCGRDQQKASEEALIDAYRCLIRKSQREAQKFNKEQVLVFQA